MRNRRTKMNKMCQTPWHNTKRGIQYIWGFPFKQNPTGLIWSNELQRGLLMWYTQYHGSIWELWISQMSLWVIITHLLFECKAFVDFCCITNLAFFHAVNFGHPKRRAQKLNSHTGENTKPQRTAMPRPHPARASQRHNPAATLRGG